MAGFRRMNKIGRRASRGESRGQFSCHMPTFSNTRYDEPAFHSKDQIRSSGDHGAHLQIVHGACQLGHAVGKASHGREGRCGGIDRFFHGRQAQGLIREVAKNYTDLVGYPRAKVMALKPVKLCYEQAR